MLDSVMQHYQQRHQKHPIALNCFFFGKTLPGPCIVEIEELKASGKGYCICRAVLKQYKVKRGDGVYKVKLTMDI